MVALLLSACSTVKIQDEEFCADMGSQGATCAHLLTNQTRDIEQPEWDNTRFGWFCTTGDDLAEMKKEIEELCSVSGKCDYATQQALAKFFSRVKSLRSKAMGTDET